MRASHGLFDDFVNVEIKVNVFRLSDVVQFIVVVGDAKVTPFVDHQHTVPVLESETSRFLDWLNALSSELPLLKAGLGHLWFVTLHPFDDGSRQRFYSLSAQIQCERKTCYDILEQTQKGSMDVTAWLTWFLDTLHRAIDQAQNTLDR